MKSARGRSIFIVAGVFTLAIIASALFSLAQQGLMEAPAPLVLPSQSLSSVLIDRVPHPACSNCFKVADGRYGIFEEVPGTGIVLTRDLPDPAPLKFGEVRAEFDAEGEQIWYKGNQGYVGPTDEEPFSAELPVPRIDLLRIKARHEEKIMSIRGVSSFGIGIGGFIVTLDPKYRKNARRIPIDLEGVPVEVEEGEIPILASHSDRTYRPVPLGAGVRSATLPPPFGLANGTVGPHIVRDEADLGPGQCCQILSLTAAHVVKPLNDPPLTPNSPQAVIFQGTSSWGTVALSFQLAPCDIASDPNRCNASSVTNDMRVKPDVAVIAHINTLHKDPFPKPPPCNGSLEPVRRMQFGGNDFVHGPTGVIRIALPGTSVKAWGAFSHAPKGDVKTVSVTQIIEENSTGFLFRFFPLDEASVNIEAGDSGGLVAWNGERHVAGLIVARKIVPSRVYYIGADHIKTALSNAGMSFDHYWGTRLGVATIPSNTEFDQPCS